MLANHVTLEDIKSKPLTQLEEELLNDEAAINRMCNRIIAAAERTLDRKFDIEADDWQRAQEQFTDQQRFAIWFEALESL